MSKKENFKRVLLCAIILMMPIIGIFAYNSNTKTVDIMAEMSDTMDKVRENVANSIVYVESRGNLKVVHGTCCGPMQIKPCLVKTCNQILKDYGIKNFRFTLQDRFNLTKSKMMFKLYNLKYNPGFNIEKAIRSWNGGPGYTVKGTQRYYNTVMKHYRLLTNKK